MALCLGSTSCAERPGTTVPLASSTAAVSAVPAAAGSARETEVAAAAAGAESAPLDLSPKWVEAVRLQRWREAATLIDALPDQEKLRPEVRYTRARVAIALGDDKQAVSLLEGLEARLPLLAKDIVRWRAEAAVEAGPFAEAAAYFGRSKKPEDLVRAALALERGGDAAAARRMVDKAIVAAQKAKARHEEAEARAIRARLFEAAGQKITASADWHWIARHEPSLVEEHAAEAIAKAKSTLSTKERMDAIGELVDRGDATHALAEIDQIEGKPGVPKLALLEARAMALFKSRDYARAAKAFQEASAIRGGRAAEPLYYAARALARSDQIDQAIELYDTIVKRFPRTFHGERSAFLMARLLVQRGRYDEAVKAYNRYTSRYPRGDSKSDAEYEKTLAMLSTSDGVKDAKAAEKRLEQLARRTHRADEAAKLKELEGLAALRGGDRDRAVTLWNDVIAAQPLSWAALMARARLAEAKAPVPPLLPKAPERTSAPLSLKLPEVPALLASVGLDADAESYLAADEKTAASPYPGREGEALCGLYGLLAGAKRRFRVGASSVSLATLMRAPSEADRWAWECVYPRPYEGQVQLLEEKNELPRGFVYAIMRQESAFDPAIVSAASAVGLMQLMPGTARRIAGELGIELSRGDLTSPEVNLRLGAFYLGKLLKTFRGSIPLAAAAYNAGPAAVTDWLAGGRDHEADLWVARIPYDETRNYVARVVGNLARYQYLEGGEDAVQPPPLILPNDVKAGDDAY